MNIYKKLIEVQNKLKVPKSQYNNFGKYNYRNAEDILEAVKPILENAGATIFIKDSIELIGDRFYVKATVSFVDIESGNVIETSALARESEEKKGMDSAQVTGATSSYARKYCLNGLFGIDDAKDADTDEHKHQQNAAAKQSKPSPTPEQVLKAFTDAAMQKNTVEELKQAFAKAWKMLEGTPEQHKAQDVYNIRRDELEGAAA